MTVMRQRRRDMGISQADLARRVRTTQGRLSEYETARRYLLPSSRLAGALARELATPVRALQDPIAPAGSVAPEEMRRVLGTDIAEKLMEKYGGMRLPTIAQMEAALADRARHLR